jgi:Spy/CpxP family protein refolding chaperone
MKQFKKKSLFAAILALGAATLATFALTSCSAVSKDILNNMVNTGDGTKFSKNVTLEDEIKAALTDKSATDAYKGKIVDKLLVH